MILRPALATALATAVLTVASHAADFDRTLPVSASPDLYVSTGSGDIHIVPGSDSQIHIHARVKAGWNAGGDIEARITRISQNPPIEQSGNTIHIGDVRPEDRRLYNNIQIDYEISAPKSTALNVRSGSGDIEIDNLGRFLKGQTGSGNLRAHGVAGPSEVGTGSGDIELDLTGVGEVKASTGSGNIHIHNMDGILTARTGSGDIDADGAITGSSRIQTGSGNIKVHVGPSAHFNAEASTGSGTIRIMGSKESEHHHVSAPVNGGGPTLEAHTGSGDITIT
jgi:DUF4097 and DUF4098 domain-containing protein YvlB